MTISLLIAGGGLILFVYFVALPWMRVYWKQIMLLILLAFGAGMTMPDRHVMAQQEDIASTFRPQVAAVNAVGEASGRRSINYVNVTIQNGSNARIYDIRVRCSFGGRPPQSLSDPTMEKRESVLSQYAFSYVEPGESKRLRIPLEENGYLRVADPASFQCQPRYEYEKADLFKAKG